MSHRLACMLQSDKRVKWRDYLQQQRAAGEKKESGYERQ